MNNMHTNVHFDYGGCYSEDHEWISRNSLYAISLKASSLEDITYSVLVDKICKKIGIDETTGKLKLSYSLSKTRRESYIVDDEDVFVYLTSLDKEGLKPVLQVELLNGVENNERMDQISRGERGSSFGVNYEELVSNGRVDEMENADNVDILTILREGGTEEQHNETIIDELRENVVNENVGNDDCENVSPGEFATMDSPLNKHLDASVHKFVDLPSRVEEVQCEEWEDGTGLEIKQEFCSREAVRDLVLRAATKNCFAFETVKSDTERLMLRCRQASKGCKWYLRVAKSKNSVFWSVRVHQKMHTCSRADASSCKQRGTQRLVANLLHEEYPGRMDTPPPKSIVNIVQGKLSLECSYSTALRGKKRHVSEMRGSPGF